MLDVQMDRLEKAEEEWFSKSSEIMKESAVVWTPLDEVVVPQLQKIGDHHEWNETERALSIYGKTGKYAIALYYVLGQAGHDHAERMIDVVVPNETIGRKIQSFFRIITGENLPWGNIYVCDPSEEWGPDSVGEDVYANEEVEPLIPGLFEPKAVEPEEDGKRKMNLILEPVMKYDVVIGNPPYQAPEGERNSGSINLWSRFVRKSVDLLKVGGILSLIHPGSWKSYATPGHKSLLRDVFQENKVHYLNIGTAGKHFPSVSSTFDWYVMEKSSQEGTTSVITETGGFDVNLQDVPCIPDHFTEVSFKVTKLLTNKEEKLSIEQDHSFDTRNDFVSDEKGGDFCYPLKHTSGKVNRWSSKKHPVQEEKKVLMSLSGDLNIEFDAGEYGVTHSPLYILVENEDEAEYVIALLKSNLYTYFREANKWSGYHHKYLLKEMPYVKGLDINNVDEELYDHFNLSDDEIKEIEQFL